MPKKRVGNHVYHDNMRAGELLAWAASRPAASEAVMPARAMVKPTHGLTIRPADDALAAADETPPAPPHHQP